jgi:hypothetical protein
MGNDILDKFQQMGARVKVTVLPIRTMVLPRRARFSNSRRAGPVSIDIRHDKQGEYFDLRCRTDVDVQVLEVRPKDRHLLLMSRERAERGEDQKSRFLCGHDERSWFVAAVPESAHAASVQSAKDALKPQAVWASIRRHGVSMKDRDRRRTDAFVRQGEWFFIPNPRLNVKENLILRDEPIRRGSGKPHRCQFVYRNGGEMVYVSPKYPNGITDSEYAKLPISEKESQRWTRMARNARVFAKGSVRHPDHKTIQLYCWHEVVMNTETSARAMSHVAFLD